MKELTLARLKELLAYDENTGSFTWARDWYRRPFGSSAGSKNTTGHIQISIDSRLYLAHRLAWLYTYGNWPEGVLDHINRVKDDNRICNIRQVTSSENCQNTSIYKNNTSGHRGISWRKARGKWAASIKSNNQIHHLGFFTKLDDAKNAYIAAASKLHTCNPLIT